MVPPSPAAILVRVNTTRILPFCLLGLAACSGPSSAPGPPPSAFDLFGTEHLAVRLSGPELGELRSVVALEVDGRRLLGTPLAPEGPHLDATLEEDAASGRFALTGRLGTPFGVVDLAGHVDPGGLVASVAPHGTRPELLDARLDGEPTDGTGPVDDYAVVARALRSAVERSFVDARALGRTPAQRMLGAVDAELGGAQDDFDVLAGFARASGRWPEATLGLARTGQETGRRAVGSLAALPDDLGPHERYLSLADLTDVASVDAAFGAFDLDVRTLVLDLRGGGPDDLHLVRCAPWLGVAPEHVGTWRTNALYRDGAVPDESAPLPVLDLVDACEREPAFLPGRFAVDVGTVEQPLEADVTVLLDAASGGGAVALAAALEEQGDARVIGRVPERAGELAWTVDLPGGWVLTMPVAQHQRPDGQDTATRPPVPSLALEGDDALTEAFGRTL